MTLDITAVRDFRLELRSDPKLLQAVRKLVYCYVSCYGFSDEQCREIVLAVDEACANAIRHSYVGHPGGIIMLQLGVTRNSLEICLEDYGRTASQDKVCHRTPAPVDLEHMQPGGLGVQFIYQVFDEVRYTAGSDGGNNVRMRLRRPDIEEGE